MRGTIVSWTNELFPLMLQISYYGVVRLLPSSFQSANNLLTHSILPIHPTTHIHTPTCPGIQSEDTLYTRVYSVSVPAFKARTNLCNTHSKWGHFFHTPLNMPGTYKERITSIPPYTHIMEEWGQCTWSQSEDWNFDLALSKCPHFECKKLILVLALNARTNMYIYINPYTSLQPL